jgi:predicted aspartyl protease
MAGRLFGTVNCYPHDDSTGHPRLKIRLLNVVGDRLPEDPLVPLDTGFSGALMLPSSTYEFFMSGELPRKTWRQYQTMMGPLQMKGARAFIEIEGKRPAETLVETPLMGKGKLLLGRGTLNLLSVLLDGPSNLSCLVRADAEARSAKDDLD